MMSGKRVKVSGDLKYDFKAIRDSSVRKAETDINALAARDKNNISVMLWNYHDDDIKDNGSPVALTLKNIPAQKVKLYHYRIDDNHSNSYEVWKKMGSPENPTPEQYKELEKSGQLELLSAPKTVTVKNGELKVEMQLPRQAVSLIRLMY